MLGLAYRHAAALGLGVASVLAFGACDLGLMPGRGPGDELPSGIRKFQQNGSERVLEMRVGTCTRFLPPVGEPGSRVGLGWANGTGANPGTYRALLTRVASHGVLVTAANTAQSGNGVEVSSCIDQLAAARSDASGRFATAGHSQGGSGCVNAAARNPRVVTTCQVQPDGTFTAQHDPRALAGTPQAPAVIMCGTEDTLAPCGGTAFGRPVTNGDFSFARSIVPTVKLDVIGATHTGAGGPTRDGGLYAALVTACVSAAGGDALASQALQPNGGLANARQLRDVAFRNF